MKPNNKAVLAILISFAVTLTTARAQVAYTVTDLGTLGGTASGANGVSGHGNNVHGMIVGSSTIADNTPHAFLYTNGTMFDLNTLCDLSTSDFSVLTTATSISDSCLIIGQGTTTKGEQHAFLLTPVSVDGGNWSYVCCQWVWIQEGGGWWWETGCGCYRWHGPPKGKHPPCPPEPPHCWWYPLPCPPECGCKPPEGPLPPPPSTLPPPVTTLPPPPPMPPPRRDCWCCINGRVVELTESRCREGGGQCYGSRKEALKNCSRVGPPPPNYPNTPPPPPPTTLPPPVTTSPLPPPNYPNTPPPPPTTTLPPPVTTSPLPPPNYPNTPPPPPTTPPPPLRTMPLKLTPPPPTPPTPPTPPLKIPGKVDLALPGKPTPTPTATPRGRGTGSKKKKSLPSDGTVNEQSVRHSGSNSPGPSASPNRKPKTKAKSTPTPTPNRR